MTVVRFEEYRTRIADFASFLAGFDLSSYKLVVCHENKRSVASKKTHLIAMDAPVKDCSFYNKLDVYYSSGEKYSPFTLAEIKASVELYEAEWRQLLTLGEEEGCQIVDLPSASEYMAIPDANKLSKVTQIGDVERHHPSKKDFNFECYVNRFWKPAKY